MVFKIVNTESEKYIKKKQFEDNYESRIKNFSLDNYLDDIIECITEKIEEIEYDNFLELKEKNFEEINEIKLNQLNFNTLYNVVNVLKLEKFFNFLQENLSSPNIEEISFNNFKSFGEKLQTIKLKPITLIYVPNSVGKSSFQHSLILLHYFAKFHLDKKDVSIDKIDIFGDEIDLGGFENYVHKHETNRVIHYKVKIDDYRLAYLKSKEKEVNIKRYFNFYHFYNNLNKELILFFGKIIKNEVLQYNLNIKNLIDKTEKEIGNIDNFEKIEAEFYFILKKVILEVLMENIDIDNKFFLKFKEKFLRYVKYQEIFSQKKPLIIEYFIGLNGHKSIYNINNKTYKHSSDEKIDDEIKNLLNKFDEIIYSKEIQYIGPLRYYPERNYNLEKLNKNYSYSSSEMWKLILKRETLRKDLNSFLSDKNKLKSHYNLEIKDDRVLFRDLRTNTVVTHKDIGLGISQVLPILISSLYLRNKTIIIEQPELHLHPAIQAELGDEIIKSYRRGNNNFFIETHSEYLLLRIMRRMRYSVEDKNPNDLLNISANDVALLYVDCDENKTYILELELSDEGKLLDRWPGGFFEEGFKERFL